jgi:hypothetical protein
MATLDTTKYVPLSTPRKSLTGTSDVVNTESPSMYSVSNINEMLQIRNSTYEEVLYELITTLTPYPKILFRKIAMIPKVKKNLLDLGHYIFYLIK